MRAMPGWLSRRSTAISRATQRSYPSAATLAVSTTFTAYSLQCDRVVPLAMCRA